ncbi:N-terminal Xaa-Pro-Lys N-methyltransferase 1-B isoform X2 [Prorops nasuta]|uniref:N-terminal Xaa-Pro-Lys N-methyltransferase 1-B isoform X2 n=1 Tax=Prorops nasuta TaxID=863751 RepID=UPI0034CDF5FA
MDMESSCKDKPQPNSFYTAAEKYWDNVPATLDGILGGFGFISQTDISGSDSFLSGLFQLDDPPGKTCALDCGAGIGRVTKNLLVKWFKQVDLVEQNKKFIDTAKSGLSSYSNKIGQFYNTGLQNFCPEPKKYDVIWCQWVLGHLEDEDLIQFLKNCSLGLNESGILIIKENVTSSDESDIDSLDSSVTRSLKSLKYLCAEAGLICVRLEQQHNMPAGLYRVYMMALRPDIKSREND